jgi:acetoacetate decarboxylase
MLKRSREGLSIPLDASLYGALGAGMVARDAVTEYLNCECVMAFFTTTEDVEGLLPEGVELAAKPPNAAVFIAHYPFSTLGPYYEMFTLIQVDFEGELAYYLPYIYVDNDAAMAGGREVVGAPKKFAKMGIVKYNDLVMGYLERPPGKRLLSITIKPEQRIPDAMVEAFLQEATPIYSIRLLPPIEGGDGLAQLVKWYGYIRLHEDDEERVTYHHVKLGTKRIWGGETTVLYDSPSLSDPVHKIEVKDVLLGAYMQYDMGLRPDKVVKEWRL